MYKDGITLKTVWRLLYKVKYNLTIQSSHHTTWYLSEGFENLCKQKSTLKCLIAKTQNHLRCLSECEWINKLWHIQTMKHYLILKRSFQNHEKICNDFKYTLLNETSKCE